MTALTRAIEDAKLGGWESPFVGSDKVMHQVMYGYEYPVFAMLLQKDFWLSLSKMRGWDKKHYHMCCDKHAKLHMKGMSGNCAHGAHCGGHFYGHGRMWDEHWHGLIDALASGSSIEDYFISLEKEV